MNIYQAAQKASKIDPPLRIRRAAWEMGKQVCINSRLDECQSEHNHSVPGCCTPAGPWKPNPKDITASDWEIVRPS